ncbi:MAG TPA: hypothetical protein VI653_06375 [Steroidobacteraceae bacterium]
MYARPWAAAAATLICLVASAASPDTKPVPRLPDGHPDLNGTWDNGSGIDFVQPQKSSDGSVCIAGCAPAAASPPPPSSAARQAAAVTNIPHYKPQFLAKVKDLDKRQVDTDPVLRCKNPGLPRIGPPDKIVQQSKQIVFLYDDVSGAFWRIIPMDGRPHRSDVDPSYLGDSVGHWEGDTLVIDANQFNEDSWLTDNGAFHTADLRVTERLHRVGDTIEYQAVVEDPKVLTEPWKPRARILKLTQNELVEPTPCVDQDLKHLMDDSHHANPR